MKRLIILLLIVGCDNSTEPDVECIIDCVTNECTTTPENVELWNECYNIEETTVLWLVGSSLIYGEIPPEIGNLTNLTQLYLYSNELTGEIPESIGNLTNLTQLYLYSNELTGEIPKSIGNLTNLT